MKFIDDFFLNDRVPWFVKAPTFIVALAFMLAAFVFVNLFIPDWYAYIWWGWGGDDYSRHGYVRYKLEGKWVVWRDGVQIYPEKKREE
jgi:hypothetical protein